MTAIRHHHLLRCAALAAGALLVQACATASRSSLELDPELAHNRPSLPAPARPVTAEKGASSGGRAGEPASALLYELQRLYRDGLHSDLIARARAWEEDPSSLKSTATTRAAISNLEGMSLLLTGNPRDAEQRFQRATSLSSDKAIRSYHAFNWAAALHEQSKWKEAGEVLERDVTAALLDPVARAKATSLRSRILLQTGDFAGSARGWLELHASFKERFDRKVVAELLGQALDGMRDPAAVEELRRQNEGSDLLDEVLVRQAELASESGDMELVRTACRALLERFPKSTHAAFAEESLRKMRDGATARPMTVGALLPMSGKFARFGRKSLQGLELALGIHGRNASGRKITLIVEDSGDEPEKALEALERLHSLHQVQLVVGPMTSKGVDALTRRAEELGLPMLTLAQQSGVEGEFIFPIGLTPQAQAGVLARHAIRDLRVKRFAIAHPRNRFGEQYAFAFWDAVEALGGDVRGIESYDENETDFRGTVDRLVGLDPVDARGAELAKLAREREEQGITKRNSKTEKFYSLPPLADFEAVFIADEPRRASQLIPTFEFRDVEGLQYFGTASWNSPDLLLRMPVQAERAYFTDAYNPSSESSVSRKFSDEYRLVFAQEPSTFESLAFDAGTLARRAVEAAGTAGSRDDVRSALRAIRQFIGVSGRIVSDAEGSWDRSLPVLTVKDGQIVSAER